MSWQDPPINVPGITSGQLELTDAKITAKDASEIQPAIDKLAENVRDGSIRGGTVKLLQKAYYPTTTIWLKKGVVLEGTSPWPQQTRFGGQASIKANGSETGTTLYTSQMPTGEAYDPKPTRDGAESAATYAHFNSENAFDFYRSNTVDTAWRHDNTHPHLPVVANYNQMPIRHKESASDYVKDVWGDGVGLRNLRIVADRRRYWDPADEPDTSEGSESITRKKKANYFGVYDGFIFENMQNLLIEGVRVGGFAGYNGFYQDIREVISRGNVYGNIRDSTVNTQGSATDHHASSFQFAHSNAGLNRYMRGQWSVKVTGPTPTVKFDNHGARTVAAPSGDIKNEWTGTDVQFLSDVETTDNTYTEADYDAGNAPIVDTAAKHVVVHGTDMVGEMRGHKIEGDGAVAKDAFLVEGSVIQFSDININVDGIGFDLKTEDVAIYDSLINAGTGIKGSNWLPSRLSNIEFRGTDGIEIDNTTGLSGPKLRGVFTGLLFRCTNALTGSNLANQDGELHMDGVAVTNNLFAGTATDWQGILNLGHVRGYTNRNMGASTQSGDGAATSFTIAHGLDEDPSDGGWFMVIPTSAAADGDFYVTADATNITITYGTAPANGTDNLSWNWMAKGWSAAAY